MRMSSQQVYAFWTCKPVEQGLIYTLVNWHWHLTRFHGRSSYFVIIIWTIFTYWLYSVTRTMPCIMIFHETSWLVMNWQEVIERDIQCFFFQNEPYLSHFFLSVCQLHPDSSQGQSTVYSIAFIPRLNGVSVISEILGHRRFIKRKLLSEPITFTKHNLGRNLSKYARPCGVKHLPNVDHDSVQIISWSFKESRANLACLYRTLGRFLMLQLIIIDSRHFTQNEWTTPIPGLTYTSAYM